MTYSTLLCGSLDALRAGLDDELLGVLGAVPDVVVVPTAAAFTGATTAAMAVAQALEGTGMAVEALMVVDRTSADDEHFVRRIERADVVVLCDGSPLHARTVWRTTAVGAALNVSTRLIALGAVASVLFDDMIDPRGGAPTTGLGYRHGLITCAPQSEGQLARTRVLLDSDATLCVIGPAGVLGYDDDGWHVVGHDVVVTRGERRVTL